jgi:hypothetical protein
MHLTACAGTRRPLLADQNIAPDNAGRSTSQGRLVSLRLDAEALQEFGGGVPFDTGVGEVVIVRLESLF